MNFLTKISNSISKSLLFGLSITGVRNNDPSGYNVGCISNYKFSRVIFLNIIELLTDICNDVKFHYYGLKKDLFADFEVFFYNDGKQVMARLFYDGIVVIGQTQLGFRILKKNEYIVKTYNDINIYEPLNKNIKIHLLTSDTYDLEGISDREILKPFLRYIDTKFNASDTITERLGNLIVFSPEVQPSSPIQTKLEPNEKLVIEKEISTEYGMLKNQKQALIFPKPMKTQQVGLGNIDTKLIDQVKFCICAIADRIKVPSTQIAMIESTQGRSLSNGGEVAEGDVMRYQSFERLLNQTFMLLADQIGLRLTYTIEGKPVRENDINNVNTI